MFYITKQIIMSIFCKFTKSWVTEGVFLAIPIIVSKRPKCQIVAHTRCGNFEIDSEIIDNITIILYIM